VNRRSTHRVEIILAFGFPALALAAYVSTVLIRRPWWLGSSEQCRSGLSSTSPETPIEVRVPIQADKDDRRNRRH
jgi:hypothetical protein